MQAQFWEAAQLPGQTRRLAVEVEQLFESRPQVLVVSPRDLLWSQEVMSLCRLSEEIALN